LLHVIFVIMAAPRLRLDLRDAIQHIAVEWPSYGRPKITAELRRRGWKINPKRVYRLMREDNLLCVRKRKFVVTTNSNHGRKVYPNRATDMVVTDMDQLWVSDITYIRLQDETFPTNAAMCWRCSARPMAMMPRRVRKP
jgi:putative transposase